ncbi:zinc finger MYM-type protein 1-like [Hydra vulgaris]|uniref:Zinc finger MYM-type protein 1-like n=1 Tax=Hydra vulgaris TaxID=6087 RepID=A0ABM4CAS1_HYDVU
MSKTRSQFTHDGFCDWKHADNRLTSHKTSKGHLNSVINLAVRSKELGRINNKLIKQSEDVKSYRRNIIKRLVSLITFICERGLALRGKNEIVGSSKNGNYIGILELLAEYDNFLKQHIENHANRGSGHTNFLSSTIYSTSDEGHIDQLTLVFRYIEKDTPVERFLVFMPNQGHKAQDMYDGLINFLNKYDLNIKNCRGQSYDNASVMSGKYNGLQSKILKNNKLASWIPCATHSLNLVRKTAVECCTAAVEFFYFLEQLYVFFTASTKRYELMVKALSLENTKTRIHVPQRVNTTRWSCRSDATKALILGYKQFKSTLIQIADDFEKTTKARYDTNCLYNKLYTLETGIYMVFRNNFLERVDKTNKLLQDATLDLNTAISAIKSLKNFVQAKRDNFDQYEKQRAEISETTDYLKHRKQQRSIRLNPIDFYETPEDDIDEHLGNELIQFKEFYKHFKDVSSEFHNISQEHLMYKILFNKKVKDCFPNVEIVHRIYLVIMITNSSSERSFSNIKHIKNRLRTSMDGDSTTSNNEL